jgi:hypothetical protein
MLRDDAPFGVDLGQYPRRIVAGDVFGLGGEDVAYTESAAVCVDDASPGLGDPPTLFGLATVSPDDRQRVQRPEGSTLVFVEAGPKEIDDARHSPASFRVL